MHTTLRKKNVCYESIYRYQNRLSLTIELPYTWNFIQIGKVELKVHVNDFS